jgi:spondin-2
LEGRWSKEVFPKHFPEKRPPAHFSQTFGITHVNNYTLFKVDQVASDGMSEFCQTSKTEMWENEDNEDFVFDEFSIPKLEDPLSKIEGRLFVQSNFSYISLVTKLIPSPDW